jgi:hypothetical protein
METPYNLKLTIFLRKHALPDARKPQMRGA